MRLSLISLRWNHHPFLHAVRVVIRPRLLAGRELIEARPERARTKPVADPGGAVTEALTIVLGVPVLLAIEVEYLHAPDCRAGRPEVSAQGTFPRTGPDERHAAATHLESISMHLLRSLRRRFRDRNIVTDGTLEAEAKALGSDRLSIRISQAAGSTAGSGGLVTPTPGVLHPREAERQTEGQ
jgi:hypothetical protein